MASTRVYTKDIPEEEIDCYLQLCVWAFLKEHRRLVVKRRSLSQLAEEEGFPGFYLYQNEEGDYVLSIESLAG